MSRRFQLLLAWGIAAACSFGAAASDPSPASLRFGFVGLHGGVFAALQEYGPALDVQLSYFTDEDVRRDGFGFDGMDVVFLQHLRAEDKDR